MPCLAPSTSPELIILLHSHASAQNKTKTEMMKYVETVSFYIGLILRGVEDKGLLRPQQGLNKGLSLNLQGVVSNGIVRHTTKF